MPVELEPPVPVPVPVCAQPGLANKNAKANAQYLNSFICSLSGPIVLMTREKARDALFSLQWGDVKIVNDDSLPMDKLTLEIFTDYI
jgi:hypothetical protein